MIIIIEAAARGVRAETSITYPGLSIALAAASPFE
jgi:hypothetical protein